MDTLEAAELSEPQLIEVAETIELMRPQRKRESGYARMKRRALMAEAQKREHKGMAQEIDALEALAQRLLGHLDAATSSDLTAHQRQGYRNLVADVRRNLSLTE